MYNRTEVSTKWIFTIFKLYRCQRQDVPCFKIYLCVCTNLKSSSQLTSRVHFHGTGVVHSDLCFLQSSSALGSGELGGHLESHLLEGAQFQTLKKEKLLASVHQLQVFELVF